MKYKVLRSQQSVDVYERLAARLDDLPAGFPRTNGGAEIRILKRLFSPEDAELFIKLSLIAEEPKVFAYRTGISLEVAEQWLTDMDRRGLVYSVKGNGQALKYRIQQFMIGFAEQQTYLLSPELIKEFDEYFHDLIDLDLWQKVPQMRVIPVNKSISFKNTVLPYESVIELIDQHKEFCLLDCICRKKEHIIGRGCNRPVESCLSMGFAAERNKRLNRGRIISRTEALEIIALAEKDGRVLQTGNAKKSVFICTCCTCCCYVLRGIKTDPRPADRVSSPFNASLDQIKCIGCGTCQDRCPMDAISITEGQAHMNADRCIGCGLCISTCPSGALTLSRKPESKQFKVPATLTETYLKIGRSRGKLSIPELIGMKLRSWKDRVMSR